MPIWNTISRESQPRVTLVRWRIIETPTGERHFNGYCLENQEGRVSSAILEFDRETRIGITRSGRVYRLAGNPGYDADAAYVLAAWLDLNRISTSVSFDVTQSALTASSTPREEDDGD